MGLPVPLNIAVVDRHELMRLCFENLLRDWPFGRITLLAADGAAVEAACAAGTPIHLAIVAVHPPDHEGLLTLRSLLSLLPDLVPVAYLHTDDPLVVRRAMRFGARSVWTLTTAAHEVLHSLDLLRETGMCVTDAMRQQLDRKGLLLPDPTPESIARLFTDRERAFMVAFYNAESHSMAEVAKRMRISEATACDHRKSVYAKLQVNNAVELYRVIVLWGLHQWTPPVKRGRRR